MNSGLQTAEKQDDRLETAWRRGRRALRDRAGAGPSTTTCPVDHRRTNNSRDHNRTTPSPMVPLITNDACPDPLLHVPLPTSSSRRSTHVSAHAPAYLPAPHLGQIYVVVTERRVVMLSSKGNVV